MRGPRYSVQPCDEGDGRRTWDVRLVERGNPHGGKTHSNHDRREDARTEARKQNEAAAKVRGGAAAPRAE